MIEFKDVTATYKENIGIYVHAIRQALKIKTIYSPQSFSNKVDVN